VLAAAVVSLTAQYRMAGTARHLPVATALEAAIPDAPALVFACLGVALALHGRRQIGWFQAASHTWPACSDGGLLASWKDMNHLLEPPPPTPYSPVGQGAVVVYILLALLLVSVSSLLMRLNWERRVLAPRRFAEAVSRGNAHEVEEALRRAFVLRKPPLECDQDGGKAGGAAAEP